MRLTVLGCSGTFPSAESGCSAYLVEHDGYRLLLDAGNGAIGALQRYIGLLDLDAVVLSHLHADHCIDLIAYSYARRYHPAQPPRLAVHGPRGTADRLCQVFDKPPPDGLHDIYDFRTTSEGTSQLGPFRMTLTPTAHPIECYAITLAADGRRLTYSADTGPSDDVVRGAAGSDLFLCESTWLDGDDYPKDLHMTARQAGEHAARAGVGKLVLIHTTAYLDQDAFPEQAGQAFDGPIERAASGSVYELG